MQLIKIKNMGGHHSKHEHEKHPITDAGKQIKRLYHVDHHHPIGRGRHSRIFRGVSKANSDISVAIKAFKKSHLSQEEIKAIREEVRALSKVDHPNIVRYLDNYFDDKHIFIVTEYVEGITLSQLLKENGKPLKELKTAQIIHQLSCAMNHFHTNNIIHRDLNPSNIIVDND